MKRVQAMMLALLALALWMTSACVATDVGREGAPGDAGKGGMVLVSGGTFEMGDVYGVGGEDERPVHRVHVDAFLMDRTEVSNRTLRRVYQWALDKGAVTVTTGGVFNTHGDVKLLLDITDWNSELSVHDGRFRIYPSREDFPCIEVTWYGALAFCRFRSLMEGLESCIEFRDWSCRFNAGGYRLPTEAEWEKAARGGLKGHHFPWDSCGPSYTGLVSGAHANFWKSGDVYEGIDGFNFATPVGYYDGGQRPAGLVMTNRFGLYDMCGNVEEWCWDIYERDWYRMPEATRPNPTGLREGRWRVVRGGSWLTGQKEAWAGKSLSAQRYHLRIADRTRRRPERGQHFRGFRCVRRASERRP